MSPGKVLTRRPAESWGAGAGGAGGILTLAAGLPPAGAAIITFIVGATPAAVTYLVNHGGLVGVWRTIMRGKNTT